MGVLALIAACVRFGAFECSEASDCNDGSDGVCESNGWCSYGSDECESGRRYSVHAGDGLARTCVEPASGSDADTQAGSTGDDSSGAVDCSGVSCSGLGTCVMVDGDPSCACDPGTYRVGLQCLEDPCVGDARCFFVDAESGDDANPGTAEQPWRTIASVNVGHPDFGPDTFVLLRRGQQHTGGRIVLDGIMASENAPFTLGAYGPRNEPRPHLTDGVTIRSSRSIVVRDLELQSGTDCINVEEGTDGCEVRDNYLHDCGNAGVHVQSDSTHSVILDNRVENTENHGIWIADSETNDTEDVGPHHFVVDNVLVNAFEIRVRTLGVGDIKILGNQLVGSWGVGLRSQQGGHGWVVGNSVGGAGFGPAAGELPRGSFWIGYEGTQRVSGNVVFDSRVGVRFDEGGAVVEHNTFSFTPEDPDQSNAVELHSGVGNWDVVRNLFVSGATVHLQVASVAALGMIETNAYSPLGAPCSFLIDTASQTFEQWQSMGLDQDSSCDAVPGISSVSAGTSTGAWDDPAFWNPLVPEPGWWGCAEQVGAFDCAGVRQGLSLEPIPGVELDWEGPIDVWQRYPRGG